MHWHQQTIEEVLSQLKSSPQGLSAGSVGQALQQHGKNILVEKGRRSKLSILLAQFKNIMTIILAIAAGLSFVLGEPIDGYVIIAIILGNAWMGFVQEDNAEKSIEMLRKMAAGKAMVLRDGQQTEIPADELVPGDIIHLAAGNVVPADARLIEISSLKTDESALTGESVPVEKIIDPIPDETIAISDRRNMLFKGTMVSNGTANAVITSTGMKTEIGQIADMLNVDDRETPLQKRLHKFSKQLAVIVILICAAVFFMGIQRGEPKFLMFLTALSLAVAALPEALPAVITIALARGARRLVDQKALIRHLPAVETLGSVTYICTDKTGTLTQNVMHVEKLEAMPDLDQLLLHAMALNHDLQKTDDGKIHGDSTEMAMVEYTDARGITKESALQRYPAEGVIPFDSDRMRMSSLHQNEDQKILLVKGAPVKMVDVLTSAAKDQKEKWLETNRQWASEGLRVLFFGYKNMDQSPGALKPDLENDIEFLGMVGLIDPPREDVIDAIRQCKSAGINIIMITGDQALTADAIASRLEIKDKDAAAAMTGMEMEKLDAQKLKENITKLNVYARVSPEQKVRIIESLQDAGQFVAMTGDGVNDAPSLKRADIGIAMGITGTDVAKEAADMILLDDHFNTIVKAVKEGRRIYENIRKFILYVLSCNAAEILVILGAPLIGMAVPLLPTHILWINLVTDGLPGIALTVEPAEPNVMKQKPIPPGENLFARGIGWRIIVTGIFMASICIGMQYWLVQKGTDVRTQQSFIFTLLCLAQLENAISLRSSVSMLRRWGQYTNYRLWYAIGLIVILQAMLLYVPFLQRIFKTTGLSLELIGLLAAALAVHFAGLEIINFIAGKLKSENKNR